MDESSVGNLNPFRYRGYYYDRILGLYFLTSRYYDPEIGRFISPDSLEYLDPENVNGLNLYSYCNNDPVNRLDPSGRFGISIGLLIAGFIIGSLVSTASSIITQSLTEGIENINEWQVLLDGTIGGISGLIAFSGIGAIGSAIISGVLGLVGSVGGDLIKSKGNFSKVNLKKAAVMTIMNFLLGFGSDVQNSKVIENSLKSALSNNVGFKAVSKVLLNPKASARGIQGVLNLYGKSLTQEISSSLTRIMVNKMNDAFSRMLSTALSVTLFEWGVDRFKLL